MSNPFETQIVVTQDGGVWHVEWTDKTRKTQVFADFDSASRFVEEILGS